MQKKITVYHKMLSYALKHLLKITDWWDIILKNSFKINYAHPFFKISFGIHGFFPPILKQKSSNFCTASVKTLQTWNRDNYFWWQRYVSKDKPLFYMCTKVFVPSLWVNRWNETLNRDKESCRSVLTENEEER